MKKQLLTILKSAGFVILYHAVTLVGFACAEKNVISFETAALITAMLLLLVLIPVYFLIKGRAERPWMYILFSVCLYILTGLLLLRGIFSVIASVERFGFLLFILASVFGFVCIVIFDIAKTVFDRR